MGHGILPSEMIQRDANDSNAQRLIETEAAIREQRRYLEGLTDPALRAVAARTLVALEDMLLIMMRTIEIGTQTRGATDAH